MGPTSPKNQVLNSEKKVKKVIPLVFALSVIAGPSLAWGWGEGGCSKDKANQETKTEQVEETDA